MYPMRILRKSGYEFYKKILGSPKYIVGPMVEQSELAWRILSRRYNAHLCYTPMFHSRLFSDPINGSKYRSEQWTTNADDRPLIVQFCANDPQTLLTAAKYVENSCDAVDLNLGCPQYIAKKGRYGSFLQEDWETIYKLISTLHQELIVPVTAKIRVFECVEKTIEYAKMIESAGAQMLVVHGRRREQKGHYTGLADWTKIKAVKEAVKIPVIANGNILYHDDLQDCLEQTGADGVMSAEGNLFNPSLFKPSLALPPKTYDIALEYLQICKELDTITRPVIIKSHLFKLFHASLPVHTDLRNRLGVCFDLEEMIRITHELTDRLKREEQGTKEQVEIDDDGIRTYARWRCQPYFRSKLNVDYQEEKNNSRRERAIEALRAKKALLASKL
ncbi:dihydrouridine synthase-domain-containing protein [Pilaira anomala]|nr:dihydrouridine synthase-domain-containing protein [Pilaira anomala]